MFNAARIVSWEEWECDGHTEDIEDTYIIIIASIKLSSYSRYETPATNHLRRPVHFDYVRAL